MNYLILLVFSSILIVIVVIASQRNLQENFESPERFQVIKDKRKDINDIYDSFYCKVYKVMISNYKKLLVKFEISDLRQKTDNVTYVLDLGCGTGEHAKELNMLGIPVVAVDQSHFMLQWTSQQNKHKAKSNKNSNSSRSSRIKVIQGDFENSKLFDKLSQQQKNFSHVVMYYFSFYFSKNRELLLNNIYNWLKPRGYFVVHLVRPSDFDPIVDAANPLYGFSVNKYTKSKKNRRQVSRVTFEDFQYESIFSYDTKTAIATYHEKFNFKNDANTKKVRFHIQKLKMMDISSTIRNITLSKQFRFKSITDLASRGYENQYIVYFQSTKSQSQESTHSS